MKRKRALRGRNHAEGYPGELIETKRGREDSLSRRPTSIGSKDPHALKIPARRAEYSLTENVASPFQVEPRQDKRQLFTINSIQFQLDFTLQRASEASARFSNPSLQTVYYFSIALQLLASLLPSRI